MTNKKGENISISQALRNGCDPPFLQHPAMLTGLHYQWLISFEDVTRGEHDLISAAHMHTLAHSDTIKGKRLLTWCSVRCPTVPAVYFPLSGEDAAANVKNKKETVHSSLTLSSSRLKIFKNNVV